jgi:hypothetical protein
LQNDKAANYLRQFKVAMSEFKRGVRSHEDLDITDETELLIEVDDILDELHVLKMVLTDQKTVIEDMNKTLKIAAGQPLGQASVETRTLANHMLRVEQMEHAAKKADKSVRDSVVLL